MYEVLKPFVGSYRRHRLGDIISWGDDIGPHTWNDLVERGFLKVNVPVAPTDLPASSHEGV